MPLAMIGVAVLAVGCGRDEGSAAGAGQAAAHGSGGELSLRGTWKGDRQRFAVRDGYRRGPARLVVTRQIGRTFQGVLERSSPDGPVREGLVGAFTPRGDLMAGSDREGSYSFELVNRTTLDYCYTEHGSGYRTTCGRLRKQR